MKPSCFESLIDYGKPHVSVLPINFCLHGGKAVLANDQSDRDIDFKNSDIAVIDGSFYVLKGSSVYRFSSFSS